MVFISYSIATASTFEIFFYFIFNKLKFPDYDITMFLRNIATMIVLSISVGILIKLIIKLSKKHFNNKRKPLP